MSYYVIERLYESAGIRKRHIKRVPTLALAQEHCKHKDTASHTCTTKVGKARTRRLGRWFDSWREVKQ